MAAPVHHDPSVEQILAMHAEMHVSEGLKAEVIEGTIVVSPSPSSRHALIFDELQTQLKRLVSADVAVTNTVTLDMSATAERYMPDLLVLPKDTLRSDGWLVDPADVELVAEIVSRHNARHDRVVKVRGYAAANVPVYLLIDPLEQVVTMFYEPADGCYQQSHRAHFGATIGLPEPFNGKIDTAVFS